MENILTFTVRSTHFFLIDGGKGKLLIDAGWEMNEFSAQLKAYKIPITDVRWILFTHHHPDHAGLVQQIKELSGAKLLIQSCQIPYLKELEMFAARKGGVKPINVEESDLLNPSRGDFARMGIHGEVVETPGHSPDSISLVLDSGAAFIGDLPLPGMTAEEQIEETCQSWKRLFERGAQRFFHSHSGPFTVDHARQALDEYCPGPGQG